ncbi:CPXV013 protein [Cowpox virus]|uniref:CPXV013 protein n=2 Tax=Cowpox virus TaxID=10243 RepID=A0A212PNG3_COWPX|nr:CPXV013 protein [Cowpox virus]
MEEYVNIILGDQVLTSDKKLLCSYSFFKNRFEFDDTTDINLTSYDNHDLIKKLIMFINTNELDINEDNVQDMLVLADSLNITKAIDLCTEFIKERLDAINCLDIITYAAFYNLEDLKLAAINTTATNFTDVVKDDTFISLPFDIISSIFENDDLDTKSEDEAMDALCIWMKGDAERINMVKENISKLIRVDELLSKKYILNELGCENLPPSVPRKSSSGVLYAVGISPDDDTYSSKLEMYNRVENEWKIVSDIPFKAINCMIAAIGDIVYIMCGKQTYNFTTTNVYSYNTKTNIWKKEPSTVYPRSNAGLAVVNDYIYLIGGTSEPHSDTDTDSARFTDPDCGYYDYNNRYYNPTIERRSPEDGKWRVLKMKMPVAGICSATSIGDNIYIIINSYKGVIYRCDTKTLRWRKCIKLKSSYTANSAIIAYNGGIYCINGFKNIEYRDDTKSYNYIDKLTIHRYRYRYNYSLAVLGDELFVIGGVDIMTNATHDVDVYNHKTNRWISLKQNKLLSLECPFVTFVRK